MIYYSNSEHVEIRLENLRAKDRGHISLELLQMAADAKMAAAKNNRKSKDSTSKGCFDWLKKLFKKQQPHNHDTPMERLSIDHMTLERRYSSSRMFRVEDDSD